MENFDKIISIPEVKNYNDWSFICNEWKKIRGYLFVAELYQARNSVKDQSPNFGFYHEYKGSLTLGEFFDKNGMMCFIF